MRRRAPARRAISAYILERAYNMEKFDREMARGDLYALFAKIADSGDFEKLLEDLCTYTEVEQLAQRLLCAKLLLKGYTYNRIIEITDISSATLSRVSRCLRHGSGGYREVLSKYSADGVAEGELLEDGADGEGEGRDD